MLHFNTKRRFNGAGIASLVIALLYSGCADESSDGPSEDNLGVSTCATISGQDTVLTVINLLNPAPENQTELIELLNAGIDQEIRSQDGFVSASIHQSLDNSYVVNYAQWRDEASLQATAEWIEAGNAPTMAEAFALGNPDFHPHRIVEQFSTAEVRIDCNATALTLINFLTPNAEVAASELALQLAEAMRAEVAATPGFISATVHESLDSPLVVNYAQWENEESVGAITTALEQGEAPELGDAFSLGTPDFHPFAVVGTHYSN